jgi:competence ComEA-like helix-hairpin-helix protein
MENLETRDETFAPEDADSASADWEANVLSALRVRTRGIAIVAVVSFLGASLWNYSPSVATLDRNAMATPFRVELNHASEAELHLLPGVGDKLVKAIVARRTELGGFQDVQELKDIPGIKEGKFTAIAPFVWVAPLSPPPESKDRSAP